MKKVKKFESRNGRKEDFKLKILTQINYANNPLRLLLGGTTLGGTYDKNWLTCSEFNMDIFLESNNDGIYNVQFVELEPRDYTSDGKLDLSNRRQIAEYTHVTEKVSITNHEIMFIVDAFQIKHNEYCFYTKTSKQIAFVSQWVALRRNHMLVDDWTFPKFGLLLDECAELRNSNKVCYHELHLTDTDLNGLQNFNLPFWLHARIGEQFNKVFKNYAPTPMPNKMTAMRKIILDIEKLWTFVMYK